MKALVIRRFGPAAEVVEAAEWPDPVPGPGEVVIDVAIAEVGYPDLLVIEGRYQLCPPLPFSPGKAATGRVAALGPGVTGPSLGDRVLAYAEYGAFAERMRVPAEMCLPVPDGIALDTAAGLAVTYQTAYFALLHRAGFRPGHRVLVLGASGGVGLAAVQLARAMGAATVIAAVRGPEGVARAAAAGCNQVIDLSAPPLAEDLRDGLRAEVQARTGGPGVDIVIDPVGGDLTAAALRCLAWCGHLVVIGFAAGEIPSVRLNYLLLKNISVSGLQWSDYRDRTPAAVAEAQRAIFALWQEGRLVSDLAAAFPMAQLPAALALQRDGSAKGKIVLQVADDPRQAP